VSENQDIPGGDESTASALETILAAQLHVTDVVRQDGALHRVTSLRVQGAPPEVCVELAGIAVRLHYPPTAPVSVLRRRGRLSAAIQR
jgi:hypothetical protein